ncbi:E3 ubiquitin-protein ligase BRE1-like 2 isoform X2 [Telopea speciosissima]|uniref:E3 ubiquitin-protein ligase BRE1-like 2 isoform X2 n=1 Tax=Telopea speciosissima TaxID=54955 RepID=UPI001CC7870E|nr:E3 ubiquitin-protein ligase BRE1-like 2 isoform X2 [Telopea speciosissima]
MENPEADEPDKKKRHLNSVSSAMARNTPSSPENRTVDAAVLQYQNQKLVQQLDAQKHEFHVLEGSFKELKDKQTSYDDTLITVNRLWDQLVDDLILLGVRAGGDGNGLQVLDQADRSQGSIPSCPWEEMFLCRLLEADPVDRNGAKEATNYVEEALAARHSSTLNLMKYLEDTIDAQRDKTDRIASNFHGKLSAEDAIIQQHKIDELMSEEADNLRKVIDILHSKHREYALEIQTYVHNLSMDQSEIKRLAGELEESMTELEESRRKLVNLKMQKGGTSVVHVPVQNAVNGRMSPEKPMDRTMRLREMKDSIEEAKILAASRLSELQEAQEDNLNLSKQMQAIQDELKDDKFVISSRPYSILSDCLQHWNTELERYKGLTDSLQELNAKAESAETATSAIGTGGVCVEELELQLQKCVIERNDLEIKLEEAEQDSGRKDIKAEFHVMASALSKEMGMMEAQLNRCKETACEAISLREEAHSLKALLSRKMNEMKSLADRCTEQAAKIKSLKVLIEKLQKEKGELEIFLKMHGQECFDNRDVMEIKESERRAHVQAEVLRNALEEHSLELRVKAANEAEAACQQRLAAAEAEITDLRGKLDASERDVLELSEAVKIKDGEAEAYISEIETIGQAYEDMQTQNQHLLQQVTDRDDYNIKLVSESVKTKQAQSFLLSEKQMLAKQLQQVNAALESLKLKISNSEEQIKAYLTEAGTASLENRHLTINIESAKWELADAEKELKWLKAAVSSSEKEFEHNQRKAVEIQLELESERAEKTRLEEELKELNNKVVEMSSESGEAAIQKLHDEIKECKAILKCGVCFDRPKEVVITKCYHLFCNPCIQRNLGIRHRKCPGCGTAFGQNDVRFVNI